MQYWPLNIIWSSRYFNKNASIFCYLCLCFIVEQHRLLYLSVWRGVEACESITLLASFLPIFNPYSLTRITCPHLQPLNYESSTPQNLKITHNKNLLVGRPSCSIWCLWIYWCLSSQELNVDCMRGFLVCPTFVTVFSGLKMGLQHITVARIKIPHLQSYAKEYT